FSSRRRHTRFSRDWSSDVCSSDLLAIMKDPACGPIGVITLVLLLLLKWAALVALLESGQWLPLLLAPWLGRWILPLLLLTTAYVRPGGMGHTLAEHMP